MLSKGPAKKVTIYVNEDTQHHLSPLYDSILTFLMSKGVAGATATRAVAGFGANRQLHTPKVELMSTHLPIRIEFVESSQKVEELLPALYDMVNDGLIEVQETSVVKVADKKHPEASTKADHIEKRGPAKLLRIFFGEADKWDGEPLHEAIVKKLRMMEVGGATVYRGILGYGAKGHTRKDSFLHLSRDLPIMISILERAEKAEEIRNVIESMMTDGLIVVSDVEMIRMVRTLEETGDASK